MGILVPFQESVPMCSHVHGVVVVVVGGGCCCCCCGCGHGSLYFERGAL